MPKAHTRAYYNDLCHQPIAAVYLSRHLNVFVLVHVRPHRVRGQSAASIESRDLSLTRYCAQQRRTHEVSSIISFNKLLDKDVSET